MYRGKEKKTAIYARIAYSLYVRYWSFIFKSDHPGARNRPPFGAATPMVTNSKHPLARVQSETRRRLSSMRSLCHDEYWTIARLSLYIYRFRWPCFLSFYIDGEKLVVSFIIIFREQIERGRASTHSLSHWTRKPTASTGNHKMSFTNFSLRSFLSPFTYISKPFWDWSSWFMHSPSLFLPYYVLLCSQH